MKEVSSCFYKCKQRLFETLDVARGKKLTKSVLDLIKSQQENILMELEDEMDDKIATESSKRFLLTNKKNKKKDKKRTRGVFDDEIPSTEGDDSFVESSSSILEFIDDEAQEGSNEENSNKDSNEEDSDKESDNVRIDWDNVIFDDDEDNSSSNSSSFETYIRNNTQNNKHNDEIQVSDEIKLSEDDYVTSKADREGVKALLNNPRTTKSDYWNRKLRVLNTVRDGQGSADSNKVAQEVWNGIAEHCLKGDVWTYTRMKDRDVKRVCGICGLTKRCCGAYGVSSSKTPSFGVGSSCKPVADALIELYRTIDNLSISYNDPDFRVNDAWLNVCERDIRLLVERVSSAHSNKNAASRRRSYKKRK